MFLTALTESPAVSKLQINVYVDMGGFFLKDWSCGTDVVVLFAVPVKVFSRLLRLSAQGLPVFHPLAARLMVLGDPCLLPLGTLPGGEQPPGLSIRMMLVVPSQTNSSHFRLCHFIPEGFPVIGFKTKPIKTLQDRDILMPK